MSTRTRKRKPADTSSQAEQPDKQETKGTPVTDVQIQIRPPDQPRRPPKEREEKKEEEEERNRHEVILGNPEKENKKEAIEIENIILKEVDDEYKKFKVNTFHVKRVKSTFGISHFEFSSGSKVLMVGDYKHSIFSKSTVDIRTDGSPEIKSTIQISDGGTRFTATAGDTEIADIKVVLPGGNPSIPRVLFITLTPGSLDQRNLRSKQPEVNENGNYCLYFGGKMLIKSVKNFILIDKDEKFEVIGIRKIEKNTLEIDARNDYTPMEVFIIGISVFLAA
jgi:hypothetical protein